MQKNSKQGKPQLKSGIRHRYVVNKKFQFQIFFGVFITSFILGGLLVTFSQFLFRNFHEDVILELGYNSKLIIPLVSSFTISFWYKSLLFVFIFSALLSIFSILVTNKIAGPLYAFKRNIAEMIEKKRFNPLSLRRADFQKKEIEQLYFDIETFIKQNVPGADSWPVNATPTPPDTSCETPVSAPEEENS